MSESLAWSPAGTRIVCALGGALHEVSVANGSLRSLQPAAGRGGASAGTAVAWNPVRDELFFTGSRTRRSAVVYAANPVKRTGNYDLYRIPNRGGKPSPITKSPRDEFSPALASG